MINCPKCGGLNPEGSQVCGACRVSLVNNQSAINIAQNSVNNLYVSSENENQ